MLLGVAGCLLLLGVDLGLVARVGVGLLRGGGGGGGEFLRGEHGGVLGFHFDCGGVGGGGGGFVFLVPEAEGVAVEDEGGDEQEPGEVSVAQAF